MKKLIAIAFIGGLVLASCSKKGGSYEQDSNNMLPEPEVTIKDTVKVTSTAVSADSASTTATAPAPADSAAAK